jgi:hypothetical protein
MSSDSRAKSAAVIGISATILIEAALSFVGLPFQA